MQSSLILVNGQRILHLSPYLTLLFIIRYKNQLPILHNIPSQKAGVRTFALGGDTFVYRSIKIYLPLTVFNQNRRILAKQLPHCRVINHDLRRF
jgi:hypothetical protein